MTGPVFIPERPSRAALGDRWQLERMINRAVDHVDAKGATCCGCRQAIDVQHTFAVILGWPAPLFACDKPSCVAGMQRLAEQIDAPMFTVG